MTWGKDTPEWKQKKPKAKANKKAYQLPYGILLREWNNMAILDSWVNKIWTQSTLKIIVSKSLFIEMLWVVTSWLDQGQMTTDYAQKVGGQKSEACWWSGVKSHQMCTKKWWCHHVKIKTNMVAKNVNKTNTYEMWKL